MYSTGRTYLLIPMDRTAGGRKRGYSGNWKHSLYQQKKWLDYLKLEVPSTVDELKETLIAFRDHAAELEEEFEIEGGVIPMSFIINNGDQDPSILINGFGEGYGDTGDHFAVTDQGEVIYTTVQEGYKEGISGFTSW